MRHAWERIACTARDILFGIKTCYLSSRKYFTLKCAVLLLATFIPITTIWLWREILNGIFETADVWKVVICLTVYLALTFLSYLLSQCDQYINKRYGEELRFYIDDVLIEKTSRMDLAFFDSASMSDKIMNARNNFDAMDEVTWFVFNIVSEVISIGVTFAIVCAYKWWLGIAVIILLAPYMAINKRHTDRMLALEKSQLRDRRKLEYYGGSLYNADVQFEVKLNGIGDFFLDRYRSISRKLEREDMREQKRYSIQNTFTSVLNILGDLLVLAISAADIFASRIGIGDLHYNLGMVSRLRGQSSSLMADINKFFLDSKRLRELREFIAIVPVTESGGGKLPSSNPRIEFSHVSFHYPNSEEYVLRDCSFVIEPHEKVGLLGLNGAGKSTIIKLMFRFYDPQEGAILLDGVNIREYDIYAVRRIFGVLFQDYVTYCLPLREIIALSDFS